MICGVVADDITGSNDIGIMFVRAGLQALVYTYDDPDRPPEIDARFSDAADVVLILNTNSRLDPPGLAYRKVAAATRLLRGLGCPRYFNKTCSVFRGNIGPEFDAMLDVLEQDFAVVVLGFPQNGRLTLDGVHYVHGKLLAESEFRNDPIHPMTQSHLVDILQSQTARRVEHLGLAVIRLGPDELRRQVDARRQAPASECPNYLILDVPDQASLATIAAAVAHLPVLCGSSALAETLPAAWGLPASPPSPGPVCGPGEGGRGVRPPGARGVMLGLPILAGSLMPQTASQVAYLRQQGVPVLTLDGAALFEPQTQAAELERLVTSAAGYIAQGVDVLICSAAAPAAVERTRQAGQQHGLAAPATARRVSDALAQAAALLLARTGQDRLIVAGGETSDAVCRRLGVNGMRIWQEIQPGLPSCISLTTPPLLLVLKSGSFGTPDFFAQALTHLRHSRPGLE